MSFKFSTPALIGISSFSDAFSSAYVGNAQLRAKQKVDNAIASYQDTLRDKHNQAVNYAASQSLNIASINEMQVNIDTVKKTLDLERKALVAESQVETQLNAIGAEGKTVDRLKRQVRDVAALEQNKIATDKDNAMLQALFTRKSIEQNRLANQDYTVNIRSSGGTTNPLFAGLVGGLTSFGMAKAKLEG